MPYIRCEHCGETRDTSGDYTSPANRARDQEAWVQEHSTGACIRLGLTLPAAVKGEQGWLQARVSNGTWRYGVTLDETTATRFPSDNARRRHATRAQAAGIIIPAFH